MRHASEEASAMAAAAAAPLLLLPAAAALAAAALMRWESSSSVSSRRCSAMRRRVLLAWLLPYDTQKLSGSWRAADSTPATRQGKQAVQQARLMLMCQTAQAHLHCGHTCPKQLQ
jgi:hypothetical protein